MTIKVVKTDDIEFKVLYNDNYSKVLTSFIASLTDLGEYEWKKKERQRNLEKLNVQNQWEQSVEIDQEPVRRTLLMEGYNAFNSFLVENGYYCGEGWDVIKKEGIYTIQYDHLNDSISLSENIFDELLAVVSTALD